MIEFKNFTEAISRLSISEVVFDSRNMCASKQRDRDAQARGGVVHRDRNRGASKLAFSAGFAVATALNAPIRPVIGAEQADEQADVGERGQIMRALLDARDDLEQALVHRLLDVVAAAGVGDSGHSVIQDRRDRRFANFA